MKGRAVTRVRFRPVLLDQFSLRRGLRCRIPRGGRAGKCDLMLTNYRPAPPRQADQPRSR